MKKKSVLALSLIAALGATLMVGGSLAWFSDTDEATNTFTVGSVEIVQNETNVDGTEFTQDQQLIPVGSNLTPTDDANFIHKQVTVKNTGKNSAYIQTSIAVPAALDNGLLHWDCNLSTGGWEAVDGDESKDGIQPIGTMTYDLDGVAATADDTMNVYQYRYAVALDGSTTPVADGAVRKSESPVLLNGVYIDQAADLNVYHDEQTDAITKAYFVWENAEITGYDVSKIEKLPILVATQAVQSQGFNSASEALNAAFPNHPWYTAP